jgi:pentose-5-phosphate-3-epimerase
MVESKLVELVVAGSNPVGHPTQASWVSYRISVDGGINDETGADGARAGADTFVAGTNLFESTDIKSAVTQLRRSASEAVPH